MQQDVRKEQRKLALKHEREVKKLTEELSVYKKKLQEANFSNIEAQHLEVGCNEEVTSTDDIFENEVDCNIEKEVSYFFF